MIASFLRFSSAVKCVAARFARADPTSHATRACTPASSRFVWIAHVTEWYWTPCSRLLPLTVSIFINAIKHLDRTRAYPHRCPSASTLSPAAAAAALTAGAVTLGGAAAPARAAGVPGGDKLLTGYKQLTYLLDNWDKETTYCESPGPMSCGHYICSKSLCLYGTANVQDASILHAV
jgi:hypothetical protein